jgi:hypothetical protein
MQIVWALIILGGVWDAADSFRLRNAEKDQCIGVFAGQSQAEKTKCRVGSKAQTWLWEGKRIKNNRTGKCIRVPQDDFQGMISCSFPGAGSEKQYNALSEFTRVGEHGLMISEGKCIKFPKDSDRALRVGECKEDKDDPYYE